MTRATRRAHRRREAARYRDGFTASKTDGAVTVEWANGFLTMMAASESTGPDDLTGGRVRKISHRRWQASKWRRR